MNTPCPSRGLPIFSSMLLSSVRIILRLMCCLAQPLHLSCYPLSVSGTAPRLYPCHACLSYLHCLHDVQYAFLAITFHDDSATLQLFFLATLQLVQSLVHDLANFSLRFLSTSIVMISHDHCFHAALEFAFLAMCTPCASFRKAVVQAYRGYGMFGAFSVVMSVVATSPSFTHAMFAPLSTRHVPRGLVVLPFFPRKLPQVAQDFPLTISHYRSIASCAIISTSALPILFLPRFIFHSDPCARRSLHPSTVQPGFCLALKF